MTDRNWESTWAEQQSAFDRVRAIVMVVGDPRSAEWIADRARVAESTARAHLDRLADMGVVALYEADGKTQYAPDLAYVRFREIRELASEYGQDELGELAVELKESIDDLRETYDAQSPDTLREAAAAVEVSADESRELLRAAAEWEHFAYRLSLIEDAITRYGQQPRPQGSGLVSELPLCRYTAEALKSPFAFTVPDFRAS